MRGNKLIVKYSIINDKVLSDNKISGPQLYILPEWKQKYEAQLNMVSKTLVSLLESFPPFVRLTVEKEEKD